MLSGILFDNSKIANKSKKRAPSTSSRETRTGLSGLNQGQEYPIAPMSQLLLDDELLATLDADALEAFAYALTLNVIDGRVDVEVVDRDFLDGG